MASRIIRVTFCTNLSSKDGPLTVAFSRFSLKYTPVLQVLADMSPFGVSQSNQQSELNSYRLLFSHQSLQSYYFLCINALVGNIIHLLVKQDSIQSIELVIYLRPRLDRPFNTFSEFLIMSRTFFLKLY